MAWLIIPISLHKKGTKNTVDIYGGFTSLFTRILNNGLNFGAESYEILLE